MDAFLLRNRIGVPLVVRGLLYMRVAEYTRGWRALNGVLRVKRGCPGGGARFRGFSQMRSACDQLSGLNLSTDGVIACVTASDRASITELAAPCKATALIATHRDFGWIHSVASKHQKAVRA